MKPGWQTSEFWLNVGQQVVVLLVLFGVIQPQNAQGVQEQVAKDILALCTLGVSAAAVIHYVQGRTHLKSQQPTPSGSFRAGVLALALLGLAGPALAAPPPSAGVKHCCPCGPDCPCGPHCRCVAVEPVSIFPWRNAIEQRLHRLETQPPSATPAQPPVTIHQHFYGVAPQVSPYQQLPIAGQPQQQLPIAGAPKQQLPIQGTPQQNLPIPGVPQQPLPIQGPPQQQLPIEAPTPPQQLPAQPMPKITGPTQYTRYALYRRS
jgi:hypothetical protein